MSMISEVDMMKVRHDNEISHILEQLEFYMKRCNELEASKEETTLAANELLGKIRELMSENKKLSAQNENLNNMFMLRNEDIAEHINTDLTSEIVKLKTVLRTIRQGIDSNEDQLQNWIASHIDSVIEYDGEKLPYYRKLASEG